MVGLMMWEGAVYYQSCQLFAGVRSRLVSSLSLGLSRGLGQSCGKWPFRMAVQLSAGDRPSRSSVEFYLQELHTAARLLPHLTEQPSQPKLNTGEQKQEEYDKIQRAHLEATSQGLFHQKWVRPGQSTP